MRGLCVAGQANAAASWILGHDGVDDPELQQIGRLNAFGRSKFGRMIGAAENDRAGVLRR